MENRVLPFSVSKGSMMHIVRNLAGVFILLLIFVSGSPASNDMSRIEEKQMQDLPSSSSVVLIHFWATWCEPCRVEIPALNQLSKKYQSKVRFVAVNIDDVENRGAIPGFLKKHPIDFEVLLWDGRDFEAMSRSIDPQWKEGLPATFVFHDGVRIFSKIGMTDEKELDATLRNVTTTP